MTLRRRSYIRHADGSETELGDVELDAMEHFDTDADVRHAVVDEHGDLVVTSSSREKCDEDVVFWIDLRARAATSESISDAPAVLDTPFSDLFADRDLLDQAIRAIALNDGSTYEDALGSLTTWGQNVRMRLSDGDEPTLRQMVDWGPVDVGAFDRDLRTMRDEAAVHEQELVDLDAAQEVDDQGRVLVSDPDERARLVTDDFAFECAYQRRLGASGGSESGREAYRREYTMLVDAGIDPLATMERQQRQADAERTRLERERTALARRDNERKRRVLRRDAEQRIAYAQADLDRA